MRIWDIYSPKDTKENLKTFFTHLPDAFEDLVEVNFTGLADDLSLFGGVSKVVITYEVRETYDSMRDSPSMTIYYLNNEDDFSDILVSHDEENPFYDWNEEKEVEDVVEIEGESYEIEMISDRSLTFLFQELPMLNFIYEQLGEHLSDSLEVNKMTLAGSKW